MKAAQFATALGLGASLLGLALTGAARAEDQPHNVILFVSDGLRARIVNNQTAPVMASIRDNGVRFANSHSLFPTFTTANASAMATGHFLGDTGDFSNVVYSGFQVPSAGNTVTPFLESDPVLGDVDTHYAGNYLDEQTILQAAREAGIQTAAIGKLGPVLIFDHTERSGEKTVIIDDSTGSKNGIPLAAWVTEGLAAANLPTASPTRGEHGKPGNATTKGTLEANTTQQGWMVDA